MAHPAQQQFCENIITLFPEHFRRVNALDVGSLDINGNNRYLFCEESSVIGLDMGPGPNVDVVSLAHEYDPIMRFDTIISTECFEHDMYWKESIANCIRLLKPDGLFIFTCALEGRAEHGTENNNPWASPHSHLEFNNYYHNLTAKEVLDNIDIGAFRLFYFEERTDIFDLYFYGKKRFG